MRWFIAVLAFLPVVSGACNAGPQPIRFDHLSVEQGLSQGNVWDVYQDHLGFIWIATEDGLNLYDGYSFTVFRNNPIDSTSLSNNFINCIAEDANGNLWIGTQGGLNFYNRRSNRFEQFVYDEATKTSISNNNVWAVTLDSRNNIWVGTENGLNFFNPDTKTFRHFFHEEGVPSSLPNNSVGAILEDREKRLWIGTFGGLSYLNRDGKTFTTFHHGAASLSDLSSNKITSLLEDREHVLWIGTFDGGLNEMRSMGRFHHHTQKEGDQHSLANNYVISMTEDAAGNLWVATDGALNKLTKKDHTFTRFTQLQGDASSLSSSTVTKVMFDVSGRMWVTGRPNGVSIYDPKKYGFVHYKNNVFDKSSLSNNSVTSFEEDAHGNFWVGTDGGGLNYYDRKSNTFTLIDNLSSRKVLAVEKDARGGLWIGMWQGGLNYFDPVTKKITRYLNDPDDPHSLSDNNVFYILKDHHGVIWVATFGNGLNRYNAATDNFTRYVHDPDNINSISSTPIDFLMEDLNGKLWIGTSRAGLDRFDPETNTFVHFKHSKKRSITGSLSGNNLHTIFEDSKKRVWAGTGSGLDLFDPATQTFNSFHEYDGLANDAIMGIEEDGSGRLWISTNKGLCRFDPEKHTFKNYATDDGLQGDQFNRWAVKRLSTGELLFGGNNGFNLFLPDSIGDNTYKPPVYITEFEIFNKPVPVRENGTLPENIMLTRAITLSYLQNTISFRFTALNYLQSGKNQYRYKMEGFHDEWVEAGAERKASYTNLSPGKYTFRVIASNNDGVWNEEGASIRIIITPPFWKTWWFGVLVAIFGLGIAIVVFNFRLKIARKSKAEMEEKIRQSTKEVTDQKERLEAQAEDMLALNDALQAQTDFLQHINEELQQQREEAEKARKEAEKANKAKSIFLATMSHEIRTPMNGVLGMASLLAETTLSHEQKEYTDTIRGSGEALLTVINDILDFSKIESGNLELDNHAFDLRQCIENVMDIFAAKAAEKGLDLVYQIDYQIPAQIISDGHRLRQILLNLIGNAMKFTDRGEIFVGIDLLKMNSDQLELAFQVRDTGIGIPQDKLSRLFKAFSQVDSSTTRKYGGTGLGLVISQRLIELMGGSIAVESEPGVGTSFGFTIRSGVNHESIIQYVNATLTGNEGKRILVVDDNKTNLTILKNQLDHWKLSPTLAFSGTEALQVLEQDHMFDLVITDMQMPDMDGVHLTKQIRAAHASLPVILLSSIGDESKKKHPGLFAAVLNKPVKQQQFSRVLHSVLRREGEGALQEEQKTKRVLSEDFATQYPLRILIAEDNQINQKLLIRVLNKLGYQGIEVANNGLEAVEKFDEKFYDVLLMDVQMPEMDGLEATRMIRTKQYYQPIIISMTANAMQGDREECLKAGMNDYISKPVRLEALVSLLEKWALHLREKASPGFSGDF